MEQGKRPAPRRRLHWLQVLVIVVAVGFAAWYAYTSFAPAASPYGTVEAGMLGAHYTGDALIVRDEVPYEAEGVTSISYEAAEGKLCSRGDKICEVFSSGYSTKELSTLQSYRDDLRDYQLKLLEETTTSDAQMDRLRDNVLVRAKEVRDTILSGSGNLTNLETMLGLAINSRQEYIRQKYATDQRLSRLLDDENAQKQRILSWTTSYAATGSGIVSFYSDGYEYGLTMSNYTEFTPTQVRQMIGGQVPERISTVTSAKSRTTIYRMVQDGRWAVLMLVHDTGWNPVEGQTYELQLERFENTQVKATVVSFTRSGGELLVRLLVENDVMPVLYMRTCQVTLGDQIATMKVPARAIYEQDGMTGVVVVNDQKQSFIPVNVVHDAGSYVYVTSVLQGLLFEGQQVLLF